jgi:ferredoxin
MGAGPRARTGFDVALTEIVDERGHRFVAEAGSAAGAGVLGVLDGTPVDEDDLVAADRVAADAAASMGRTVDTTDIRDLLYANADHPRWDDVGSRCLSCTNCTLVCPTCFCVTAQDTTDLTGVARRDRVWDSCFATGHSHLHGGGGRSTTRTRYRQWLTHKFASWQDQFGTSGCVGCGRCITWCPAAIDVTEELAAIRATPATEPTPEGTRP